MKNYTSQGQKGHRNSKPVRRSDGRVVGSIEGDTLRKRVYGSRHMLRTPRAWAVDADILTNAQKAGVRFVEVVDKESGTTYRTSLDRFFHFGFQLNRGFGLQVALPLEKWVILNPEKSGAVQLGFFGV